MNRTLIINGSPRLDGNTAFLTNTLKEHLEGEVIELSAFRSSIAPCVDCRSCWSNAVCRVKDDMGIIYEDNFDNVVLATPIYYGALPGQVLSLMTRFQPQHAARFFLNNPIPLRQKKAGLILTAGGKGNENGAEHHIRVLFMMLGGNGHSEHRATSLKTDTISAHFDLAAISKTLDLAKWFNNTKPEKDSLSTEWSYEEKSGE